MHSNQCSCLNSVWPKSPCHRPASRLSRDQWQYAACKKTIAHLAEQITQPFFCTIPVIIGIETGWLKCLLNICPPSKHIVFVQTLNIKTLTLGLKEIKNFLLLSLANDGMEFRGKILSCTGYEEKIDHCFKQVAVPDQKKERAFRGKKLNRRTRFRNTVHS
jgi:hypothetical protein